MSKRIVFTNGCFDILHPGHVEYLEEAKSLGDFLIVGLNSDSSVQRLKGPTRPINNEADRKAMLSALKAVDLVITFDEDTPHDLIRVLQPDVLVKGGDWSVDGIVGSDIVLANGGEVISLGFKDGYSTSNLINKIQKNNK